MFSVPVLRSCGVLLYVVSTLPGQCITSVKCMSLVMYCLIITTYSALNDVSQSLACIKTLKSRFYCQFMLGVRGCLQAEKCSHHPGTRCGSSESVDWVPA